MEKIVNVIEPKPDPNQIKKDFIFRMLTPIINTLCAEFDTKSVREMIKNMADFDVFWNIAEEIRKNHLDFLNVFYDGRPK